MLRSMITALSALVTVSATTEVQAQSLGAKYVNVHHFLASMGTDAERTLDVHRRYMQEEPAPETTEKTLAECFAACVEQQMGEEQCIAYIHKILGEDLSGSIIPNLQILVHRPRPSAVKAISYYYIGIPTNIYGDVHCGKNNGIIDYPIAWETPDGPVSLPSTDCLGMTATECCDAIMANMANNNIPTMDVNGNCLSCWVHQEAMKPSPTPDGTAITYENTLLNAQGVCATEILTTEEVATIDEGIQTEMTALKNQINNYVTNGATCDQLLQLQRDLMFWGRLEYRAMRQISNLFCGYDCVDGPLSPGMKSALTWILAVLTGIPSNLHYLTIYLDHQGLVMDPPKIGGSSEQLDFDRLDDCDGDEAPLESDVPPMYFDDGTPIPEGAGVCDAVAMSEQSGEGESCYSCRQCLLEECEWTAPEQEVCYKLFSGDMSGTSEEWLACLESNGVTDVHEGATKANGFDNWCACAVKCEKRCLKDDLSYLKDPRRKECTAEDMSKRSEENEHCHDCRLCLQNECLETNEWSDPRHWCTFLLKGQRNGTTDQWLACLESDGLSRLLSDPDAGAALIEENGGNRDTWGACARRCDDLCEKQPVTRASTEDPICTSKEMATESLTYGQVCFPCRQCLRRQCEYWRDRCVTILNGAETGTEEEWMQCLHHCGGGLQRRGLRRDLTAATTDEEGATERSLWCDCARECDDRCHHAVME